MTTTAEVKAPYADSDFVPEDDAPGSGDANPNELRFVTPPTIGSFMLDNSFVRLIMGPVGSGKSAGCFMELLRRARLQAPDRNGVRRTRMAIIRNTLQQLRQTCLADIQLWLEPIMTYRVTDATIQVRFPLPDGTKVESDWMLIPLDTPQDQQRLLSLNLTGAWVSEFREVDPSLIDALSGRLGRFPAKAIAKPTWFGIVAESNPPDEDSTWYSKLEVDRPPNWSFFRQPGGLDPLAENVENLPDNYYENLAANNNADWVHIHVDAQYGKSLGGQAVFRASFKPGFHVVDEDQLILNENMPVMVGQDFGRTPACLLGQIDGRGRLVIFDELTSEDMGIEQFATTLLRPLLYERYTFNRLFMVADPKGRDKSQTNEDSPFDVLRRLGFDVYAAPTNNIDPRIRSVEQLLLHQTDGGPQLIISSRCVQLISAMKYWYRYRRKQTGVLEDKPEKTHPWSDLADCLQYMAMSTNANYLGKVLQSMAPKIRKPSPSPRAWT
jgi:hypothetical protein